MRQLNDDPMEIMSTLIGSFSQDQTNGPQRQAQPWTSMLNSPIGSQQQQQDGEDVLDAHIKKILVPRVSGTQGNIQVREVSE